jgi:putative IMPACT (imprinted ancient) family translation regulator
MEPGEASSDAGEPAGSAGVPILGVLQSYDLWNVLGVVVRWFGGTKLGKGGLARAYREALAAAVENNDISVMVPRCRAIINARLEHVGDIHRLLSTFDIGYLGEAIEGKELKMEVSIPAGDVDKIAKNLVNVTRGKGSIEVLQEGQ